MLIKCPECGKEISNKSEKCIHCGYPLIYHSHINEECTIENSTYNFSNIISLIKNKKYKEAAAEIINVKDMSIYNCLNLIDFVELTNEVPSEYEIKQYSKEEIYAYKKLLSMNANIHSISSITCPNCHSTNVKPISGGERAVSVLGLGILSKKIGKSYKCMDCKYMW